MRDVHLSAAVPGRLIFGAGPIGLALANNLLRRSLYPSLLLLPRKETEHVQSRGRAIVWQRELVGLTQEF